jgi:hypothetical protein
MAKKSKFLLILITLSRPLRMRSKLKRTLTLLVTSSSKVVKLLMIPKSSQQLVSSKEPNLLLTSIAFQSLSSLALRPSISWLIPITRLKPLRMLSRNRQPLRELATP